MVYKRWHIFSFVAQNCLYWIINLQSFTDPKRCCSPYYLYNRILLGNLLYISICLYSCGRSISVFYHPSFHTKLRSLFFFSVHSLIFTCDQHLVLLMWQIYLCFSLLIFERKKIIFFCTFCKSLGLGKLL
jgi:hypothetical protein